ncbi:diguanylate cyclase [Marinobacter salinus]|uniref:Diguanylate cyclase n=1 Tax=Marinobacter salinus TaxID=1874317 RepID=A0A1D9GRS6_9GAMM|nr:diguanylate cyclase [Marinobacter salinus]
MAFSSPVNGQDSNEAASKTALTIGILADDKPYSFFEERTPAGFSVDILREIAANSGLTFEFRAGTWPEIYAAFMRGELDAIDGISYRSERAEEILFTDPYHIRQTFLMQDSAHPVGQVKTLGDLKSLKVGVVKNIYYRGLLEESGVDLNTYDSIASMVRALAFGWVDVIIGPQLSLEYQATHAGFRFLEIAGPAPLGKLAEEDFRIGVRKDLPDLFQKIQQGLNAIPDDQRADLLERWQEFGGASLTETKSFTPSTRQSRFLKELGPVRVGVMRDYSPFSFRDAGKLQGLTVDVLDRLADLTGLQVIPVGGQWSDLLPMLEDGEIDVLANMSKNPERLSFTRFTEPYYTIPNVAFTKDKSLQFTSLKSLKGLSVALGSDIYYEDPVTRELGAGARVFTSQEAMFEALADDRVDVVLAALPNGNFWVRELGIPGVHIAGELALEGQPSGEDLRFGVRSTLAPLADILDQALAAISPTEMNTIENRWLGAGSTLKLRADEKIRFSPAEEAWLDDQNHDISYCIDNNWLPLEGVDASGNHTGLSAEVIRLFQQRGDIHFSHVATTSWPESLEAVKSGACDMLAMAMKTPERTNYLNFTDPYLQVPNIILGRIEAPFIENVGDLRDKKVAIVKDYAFSELLENRYPGLKLVEVTNETEGLRMLQDGQIEGYVTTLATASYYMQQLGLADVKVIGRIPADWSLSIATINDEPILLGIMQKLVNSLTPSERHNLQSYWRNIRIEQSVDYSLVWQLLAVVALITAMLVYWNRKLGRLNRQLETANESLARLSVTDDLTQLGNRIYFDREFRKSFQWCQRHGTGFATAMVDADLFKNINDTHGHEAGDLCLQSLANTMRAHFRRETDRLARFGGEEFVIFTSYEARQDIIQRLDSFRKAVAEKTIVFSGSEIQLTISIGLATGIPGPEDSPAQFLRLADQALYAAKRNGRNRLEARAAKN